MSIAVTMLITFAGHFADAGWLLVVCIDCSLVFLVFPVLIVWFVVSCFD